MAHTARFNLAAGTRPTDQMCELLPLLLRTQVPGIRVMYLQKCAHHHAREIKVPTARTNHS